MRKTILSILVVSLLVLGLANAANNFDISLKSINDKILITDEALFKLTITNNQVAEDDFDLKFENDLLWSIRTEPGYHKNTEYGVTIEAGKSLTTEIYLNPAADISYSKYNIKLKVTSKAKGQVKELTLPVYVTAELGDVQYLPNIKGSIIMPNEGKIDPREPATIKIRLENKNTRNITDLKINVKSELIKWEDTTTLEPLETDKVINIYAEFDPKHPPAKDKLEVTLKTGGYTFTPTAKEFEIIDYTGALTRDVKEEKSFLKKRKEIVFTNDGNTLRKERAQIPASWFKRVFTKTNPASLIVKGEDGKTNLAWDIELAPGESSDPVTVTTNYRSFFYILLIIIILISAYYWLQSPVGVTKSASSIEKKEGGISEIKIVLNVKNNTLNQINDVEVIDTIPNIAELKKDFQLGTLKPTKVLHHETTHSSVATWKLDDLEPNEHRIISYRIKSKLSILGDFTLPPAKVRFKAKGGKRLVVQSNRLPVHN